jgi:hydroxypyruvate isomerase
MMIKLDANLSMLFTEVEFLSRFELASRYGFKGVEYLFPYAFPVAEIQQQLERYALKQVLFNLPAGDWESGDRGIACHPDRVNEFREGVDAAIEYATALGCTQCNTLAGIMPQNCSPTAARETFMENLQYAAPRLKQAGVRLLIEAINTRDIPGFYLTGSEQAISIIEEVGSDNLFYQYDIYHMQVMEGDLANTLQKYLRYIAHIQLADNPGRHEPGSGEINYAFLFRHLQASGYQGWIGCEYRPEGTTVEGLSWLGNYNLA